MSAREEIRQKLQQLTDIAQAAATLVDNGVKTSELMGHVIGRIETCRQQVGSLIQNSEPGGAYRMVAEILHNQNQVDKFA